MLINVASHALVIWDTCLKVLFVFCLFVGCRVSNDQFLEFPYNIQYISISSGL